MSIPLAKEVAVTRRGWLRRHYLQILCIVFVLALSVFLALNRQVVVQFKEYGYFGVFLISMISAATIVIPVPGWILVAALGSILNPVLVGVISGVGATIGETTGYLLGYGGQLAVENKQVYERMVRWMKRWGWATIFVLALIPNPLFDVAGMAAGVLRMPWWKFFVFGAAGRIPKHILYAYAGVAGFGFIP